LATHLRDSAIETKPNPSGILVVDKPTGLSSARTVAVVKRILDARKVGHTGTLDPFAEGVLVCCVNQATKIARFLIPGVKGYLAVLKLGVETDTQDATGNVVSVCPELNLSEHEIRRAFNSFQGSIQQQPPIYSALKHRGIPLYKLARSGRPVQKPSRRVSIFSIEVLEIQLPRIRFSVSCSAGTYIRTLCADIGKTLGCGAHLHGLKRTASSGFHLDQALSLEQLEQLGQAGKATDCLIPMTTALAGMPSHIADEDLESKIRHGQSVPIHHISSDGIEQVQSRTDPYLKIIDRRHRLLAILELDQAAAKLKYCCVMQ
jgi:tRNA pseudouridine55 synthase